MPDRIYQLLMIDDSEADVRLFKEAMRSWKTPHCLYVAYEGDEALDLLHRCGNYHGAPRPDLIFLDLNLPKMDGFQVLQRIRQDEDAEIHAIPVIVLTSSADAHDVRRAYELGTNSFITKPTDFDGCYRVFREIESFWFGTATTLPSSVPPTCEANNPENTASS